MDATSIAFGKINTWKGKNKHSKMIKILLDSGGSGTIIKHDIVNNLRIRNDSPTIWATTAGNFEMQG